MPGNPLMKPGTFTHTVAVLLSSVSSLFAQSAPAKAPGANLKLSKKSNKIADDILFDVNPFSFTPPPRGAQFSKAGERFPWKKDIVTTVFWIGEKPSGNNPVPNRSSSWDANWTKSYGGFDDPNRSPRHDFVPVDFTPRQNPFYCALPYNDKATNGHRKEAPSVVPWFQEAYQGPGVSVCKGRWVAIRKGEQTVLRTVGRCRAIPDGPLAVCVWKRETEAEPKSRRRAGCFAGRAGFSWPSGYDVTDWKFVDFKEVP